MKNDITTIWSSYFKRRYYIPPKLISWLCDCNKYGNTSYSLGTDILICEECSKYSVIHNAHVCSSCEKIFLRNFMYPNWCARHSSFCWDCSQQKEIKACCLDKVYINRDRVVPPIDSANPRKPTKVEIDTLLDELGIEL